MARVCGAWSMGRVKLHAKRRVSGVTKETNTMSTRITAAQAQETRRRKGRVGTILCRSVVRR
jgi:hypothetical protein